MKQYNGQIFLTVNSMMELVENCTDFDFNQLRNMRDNIPHLNHSVSSFLEQMYTD